MEQPRNILVILGALNTAKKGLYNDRILLEESQEIDDKSMNAVQKWKKIIQQILTTEISNIYTMFLLFSVFLAKIVLSNEYFHKWHNKCSPNLIKAELMAMFNFDSDCVSFYNYVKRQTDMLCTVESVIKYSFTRLHKTWDGTKPYHTCPR